MIAFGFPAYHEERIDVASADVRATVLAALDALGWAVRSDTPACIRATTGMSLSSWGERITAQIHDERSVSLRSECALATQCFDWGKNARNVAAFRRALAP